MPVTVMPCHRNAVIRHRNPKYGKFEELLFKVVDRLASIMEQHGKCSITLMAKGGWENEHDNCAI